jgi:hypothetical protein
MRSQVLSTIFGGVVGGCIVLALHGGLARAQGALDPGTVVVHDLNVVDSKGKVRISLRCDTNDAPRLRMMDSSGAMRCVVGLGNLNRHENPFVYLVDQAGVKGNFSIAEDGAPVLFLNGRDGKPRIFMCSAPAEHGELSQLVVYGNSKENRTEIISGDGKTGVSSYINGAMRTYTGVMPEGVAGFMANDEDGKPGTVIGVTADDRRVLARLKKGENIDLLPQSKTKSDKQHAADEGGKQTLEEKGKEAKPQADKAKDSAG